MDKLTMVAEQENNQLLLNAIKNKFAAKNDSEATTFSPPKFTIPMLKPSAPALKPLDGSPSSCATPASNQEVSPLNKFILGQLQEKSSIAKNGFILPALNLNNNSVKTKDECSVNNSHFAAPELNISSTFKPKENSCSNISSLSKVLENLHVKEDNHTPSINIDLTTALSNTTQLSQSKPNESSFVEEKMKGQQEVFDIPFIQCDLEEPNVYCQTDISNLKLNHCLVPPSYFARITCLQFKRTRNLPWIDHSFKAKHKIKRFCFDTKSPDDIIIANLSKYTRKAEEDTRTKPNVGIS